MSSSKRLKSDPTLESSGSNDSLVEPPSEVVKRKIAKRKSSQELNVEPASSPLALPKEANDSLVEPPSEVVKRKIAKRKSSQELNVEPASSPLALPKEANDANKVESKVEPSLSSTAKATIDASEMDVKQLNPEVETPKTKMLDMNAHCVEEMMQRMALPELCTMAEVSTQLKEVAQQMFAEKHRNVSLTSLADPTSGKYALTKVRQLLYNFGHLINTLTIDDTCLDDHEQYGKLLTLVLKYCLETVEKVVFLNQPGENIATMIATLMFGQNIILRDVGINGLRNRRFTTQTSFGTGKTAQEQFLVTDE